jgi:outer membrane lipoprotein-sorting protein
MVASCIGQSFVPLEDNTAFKNELIHKSRNIHALEAEFTELVFSSLLKEPKSTEGNLVFSIDAKLRWEKKQVSSEVIVSDGTEIKIFREGILVKDEGTKRVFKKMQSLMSELLTASFLESQHFNLSYFENEYSVSIVLKPERKSMAKHISYIKLIFNKNTLALTDLSIHENTTDFVQYIFTNVKYNTVVEHKLFTNY